MSQKLNNLIGYLPDQLEQKINLHISVDGLFDNIQPTGVQAPLPYLSWEADHNLRAIPGLIDIHVHGGKGINFGGHPAQVEDELAEYSAWVASTGVTGFLCSIAAPEPGQLLELIKAYAHILPGKLPGAACQGLHLEGPFLSEPRRGGFSSSWLRSPTTIEVRDLLQAGQGWIRQVTLAPELPEAAAVAQQLADAGVVAAAGHTDGDYDTVSAALTANFSHVTHTFNAMSIFHHSTPGAVGAVLTSANVTAELIADGVHVHPGAMKLLFRCLGPERIVLITDAMAGAGMPEGTYELIGSQVFVKDGQARRADGRLAGSVTTLNKCVANIINLVNIPFVQAVQMACLNPARVVHLESQIGSFKAGKDANFAIVDKEMRVYQTVVKGKVVFRA